MFPLIMLGLALLVMIVHLLMTKKTRNAFNVLEIVLLDYFVVAMGIAFIISGLEHIFNGPAIAKGIGWPPGSPFQYEVGVANLAIGIAAILGAWFRGTYWLAVAVMSAVFGIGAGIGHIRDIIQSGNKAIYNAGPVLYLSDLILPVLLVAAVIIYLRMKKA